MARAPCRCCNLQNCNQRYIAVQTIASERISYLVSPAAEMPMREAVGRTGCNQQLLAGRRASRPDRLPCTTMSKPQQTVAVTVRLAAVHRDRERDRETRSGLHALCHRCLTGPTWTPPHVEDGATARAMPARRTAKPTRPADAVLHVQTAGLIHAVVTTVRANAQNSEAYRWVCTVKCIGVIGLQNPPVESLLMN